MMFILTFETLSSSKDHGQECVIVAVGEQMIVDTCSSHCMEIHLPCVEKLFAVSMTTMNKLQVCFLDSFLCLLAGGNFGSVIHLEDHMPST